MSDAENDEVVQEGLKTFLLSLRIAGDDIVTKGYDTLLYEKKGPLYNGGIGEEKGSGRVGIGSD